jgi:signal transduction histidine kinase
LSTLRALVQQSGGEVEVESAAAGKGTTFRILLPSYLVG